MAIQRLPPYAVNVQVDDFALRDYQVQLQRFLNAGGVSYNSLNFTASNITSIASRLHNDLQGIQGGSAGNFYHLTSAQNTNVGNMPTWNLIAKPTITGSRGGNAALASLLTALASYNLITDSTTP